MGCRGRTFGYFLKLIERFMGSTKGKKRIRADPGEASMGKCSTVVLG